MHVGAWFRLCFVPGEDVIMMHCLYAGATGIKTHGEGLSTVANNLANVNTIGYKQQSALFQDLMSQNLASPLAPTQGLSQLGMGSAVGDVRTVFTQGPFEPGSSMTDLALMAWSTTRAPATSALTSKAICAILPATRSAESR